MDNKDKKKKRILVIVAAVILLVAALIIFLYFRSGIMATTMRILRMEGIVTLEDDGKEKTVRSNMRLNSGNALATDVKSLVSIGLDDTKIVTLDERSRAEFNQSGSKLELELTGGSLFFEVSKPLEDDESFDICTSTMVVGIRGTSGWVSVEGEHESLIISDGHVHVIGTNPTTGESKEIEVHAGQRISTYLYNDRSVDSIEFFLDDVTEHDLPKFMLERLRENPELLEKVVEDTEWDKPWILGLEVSEITPSATPIPVENDLPQDNVGADVSETPTATPTPTPTKEPEPKNPQKPEAVEEEQNGLLEELLAMITPSPTATPVPINTEPVEDPYNDEEEEHHESTPTATPEPTATPAPTATAMPAPTATSTPTPTAAPTQPASNKPQKPQQTTVTYNGAVNGVPEWSINGKSVILYGTWLNASENDTQFELPVVLDDGNNSVTIQQLSEINTLSGIGSVAWDTKGNYIMPVDDNNDGNVDHWELWLNNNTSNTADYTNNDWYYFRQELLNRNL